MSEASTIESQGPDAAAMPAVVQGSEPSARTFGGATRAIILFSLAVTALAASLAGVAALATDVRWSLAFVVLRWLLVAALLATPLVHQVAVRFGARWRMPWALQTPATAVLLTCESITFDILSAHFR